MNISKLSISDLKIAGITSPMTLMCIARARNYSYYCSMVEDALAGKCPFCILDPKKNRVIVQNRFWRAWQNPFPERNTKHHFIFAPKKHVLRLRDLPKRARATLFDLIDYMEERYGAQASGIMIRNNAPLLAGTIEHLHVHAMIPNGKGRVESPLYKGKGDDQRDIARTIVLGKMRQGVPFSKLSKKERELVKGRM